MIFGDYLCNKCNHIWEVVKKQGVDWPGYGEIPCSVCNSTETGKSFNRQLTFDVAPGKTKHFDKIRFGRRQNQLLLLVFLLF